MYCIECGIKNSDSAKFCQNCGQELQPYAPEFEAHLKSTTSHSVKSPHDDTSFTLPPKSPKQKDSETDDFFSHDFTTGPDSQKAYKVTPRYSGVLSPVKFGKFWRLFGLVFLMAVSFALAFGMATRHQTISYDFYTISGVAVDTILPTSLALIIAFAVRWLIPKFRSIPTYDVVVRTLWIVIILGGISLWGLYSGEISSLFVSNIPVKEAESTSSNYQIASEGRITSVHENKPSKAIDSSEHIAEVTAVITRSNQDGFDATEAQFDNDALKALDDWLVETVISKLKVQYLEMGLEQRDFSKLIKSTSSVMNIDGQELAFLKVNADDLIRMVVIFGIAKGEMLKVTCTRNSNHDVTVFSGPCGEKLFEAFGIQIQP